MHGHTYIRSSTCFEQHAAHPQEDKLYHHRLWYLSESALHLHTVRLLTEGDDTRGCGDTICPPKDEQRSARNMLRIVV